MHQFEFVGIIEAVARMYSRTIAQIRIAFVSTTGPAGEITIRIQAREVTGDGSQI